MKRYLTKEQLTEIAQELGSNWRLWKENEPMLINDQNILLYFYFTNDDKLRIFPVIYNHPIYPEIEKFNYDLTHKNYRINVTFKNYKYKWVASNIKRRLLPDLLPEFEKGLINWKKYQENINQAENIAHQIKAQFPALNLTKDRIYSVLSDRNLGINIKCYGDNLQLEINTYKDFSPEAITHILTAFYSL